MGLQKIIDPWDPHYKVVEFPIHPTKPAWSTNQDRKMHKYQRHEHVKAWQSDVRAAWKAYVTPTFREQLYEPLGHLHPGIVALEIPFAQKRKRDPHNYCGTVLKAVIDGLVQEGLWPDDTPEWVGHRESVPVIGTQGMVRIYL